MRKKWTNETIKEDALKYNTRTEWAKNSSSAYERARYNDILEECCQHMTQLRHKWSDEEIIEDAKKYNTRYEWQQKSKSYTIAKTRQGLIDICAAHMNPLHQTWTIDNIKQEALKFNSKGQWSSNSPQSYMAATRQNIVNDCCSHMTKLNKKWTIDEVLTSAKKYQFRSDWYNSERKAYRAAMKFNIFNECVKHMPYKSSCFINDIGIIYGCFFDDRSVYVGLTINYGKRLKGHLEKGTVYDKIQNGHSYEFKILEDCIANNILSDREIFYMEKMKKEGYTLLNKLKGGSRGNITISAIKNEDIVNIAKKYDSTYEWKTYDYPSYKLARQRCIIKECSRHMQYARQRIKDEEIINKAHKYTSMKEWLIADKNSYALARKRKLLKICKNNFIIKGK